MAPKKAKKEAPKPEVTLEMLVAVAEDFNSFMFADPDEGIPTDLEFDDLLAEVTETAEELEATDTILAVTAKTLDLLDVEYTAAVAEEEEEVPEPEEEEEEADEPDAEKEEEEQDMVGEDPAPKFVKAKKAADKRMAKSKPDSKETEEQEDEDAVKAADIALVKKTKDIEKMKGVAKAWGIRIPPPFYKDTNKLREYLVGKLDGSAPAPEKKEKVDKPEKKEKKAKKVGGGVIAKIAELITAAGKKGITKEAILAELVKEFPDREEKSMKNTLNVQLPNRMSKEKFPVGKTEAGAFFKL